MKLIKVVKVYNFETSWALFGVFGLRRLLPAQKGYKISFDKLKNGKRLSTNHKPFFRGFYSTFIFLQCNRDGSKTSAFS